MIPAPPGHIAYFKGERLYKKPIVAFDNSGNALVMDAKSGKLRAANSYSDFLHAMYDNDRIVSVIPGGGWEFAYMDNEGQDETITRRAPVVAWAFNETGHGTPIGAVTKLNFASEVTEEQAYLIHPEQSPPEELPTALDKG
ncbi:hypothetical protein [Nocardiopsis alba]